MAVFPRISYYPVCLNAMDQGFAARLFRPDFGNEVIEGTITIDRNAVRFISPAVTEEIPIDRVVLGLGKDDDRVDFHDPTRPDLKMYTVDESILESRAFVQCRELYGQASSILGRRELWRRFRLVGYFFGACVVLVWLGSWLSGVAVQSIANEVPPEWERHFGAAHIETLRTEKLLLDDTNRVAQLAELAQPLIRVVPLGETRVRFYIAKDPEPNAYALPGGYVVVNAGLLRMVDRPEELLAVIAHELGHVTQKHHVRHIIAGAGPLLIFGVLFHSRDGVLDILSTGSGVMIFEGFSQDYETEADEVGWKYLVAANIDPRGMVSVFRKLKASEDREKMKAVLPQAFQSHPALDKRIARLERKWKGLSNKSGFLELTNQVPQVSDSEMEEPPMKKGLP